MCRAEQRSSEVPPHNAPHNAPISYMLHLPLLGEVGHIIDLSHNSCSTPGVAPGDGKKINTGNECATMHMCEILKTTRDQKLLHTQL